jgi:hypothetical protein
MKTKRKMAEFIKKYGVRGNMGYSLTELTGMDSKKLKKTYEDVDKPSNIRW